MSPTLRAGVETPFKADNPPDGGRGVLAPRSTPALSVG